MRTASYLSILGTYPSQVRVHKIGLEDPGTYLSHRPESDFLVLTSQKNPLISRTHTAQLEVKIPT